MSNRSLLVIDDDEIFLNVLSSTLGKNGYSVTPCIDPQGAQHLFKKSEFDAVICDIRFGGTISGLDLLAQFKKERPSTPFILMTGFAEIIETIQADSLGANAFLPKPFRQENLLSILDGLFSPAPKSPEPPKLNDDDYIKLNIDDFISGKDIKYDIFVRLSSGKYIKIANQGEDIARDQVKKYKEKGLRHLYLRRVDFQDYLNFNLKLVNAVAKSENVDKVKKVNFLKHTGELMLSKIFTDGVDRESLDQSMNVLQTTLNVLSDDCELFELLNSLNSHTDSLYAHSLAVSLYSSMIARQLSYTSPSVLYKISFAGLFHDIGKKQIDVSILNARRTNLTPEQIQIYETHAARGMEIMSQIRNVPTEILQVILQHHENCTGTGFPARLNRTKIHPFAKIVGLASDFSAYVVKSSNADAVSPPEAIERMLVYPERYDRAAFCALMRVCQMPVPPEFELRNGDESLNLKQGS